MRKITLFFLLITGAMIFNSCENDDKEIPVSKLTIKVILPEEMASDVPAAGLNIELVNTINNNIIRGLTDENGSYSSIVEQGIYNIKVTGERTYNTELGNQVFEQTVTVNGVVENFSIAGYEVVLDVNLFISLAGSGWVFEEIYFSGSRTPQGTSYRFDTFFEIYNNSDKLMYADGISIGEADHVTAFASNMWANIINEAFVTHVIYTIPGSGTDYPVLPGESILIADVAIDHRNANPNSFDLSNADFEWYDDHMLDVDVPEAPNLIRYFSFSASVWTPHNRGFRGYVIFKPKTTMADFLSDNFIEKLNPNGTRSTRYKIPNNLILDAVELGTPSAFLSKAIGSSLDVSFTHSGDGDDARFGKSVRRKIQSVASDGRVILMDTNNSAVDFLSTATPTPGIIGK